MNDNRDYCCNNGSFQNFLLVRKIVHFVLFDKNIERFRTLADERAEKEDFLGALKFLLSARNIDPENLGIISDIADLYADTGLLELSNKFWFLYLNKAPKEKRALAYEELAINYFYLVALYWAVCCL